VSDVKSPRIWTRSIVAGLGLLVAAMGVYLIVDDATHDDFGLNGSGRTLGLIFLGFAAVIGLFAAWLIRKGSKMRLAGKEVSGV
jgi:cell division protein FtsX